MYEKYKESRFGKIERIGREPEPLGAILQDLMIEINYERISLRLKPVYYRIKNNQKK